MLASVAAPLRGGGVEAMSCRRCGASQPALRPARPAGPPVLSVGRRLWMDFERSGPQVSTRFHLGPWKLWELPLFGEKGNSACFTCHCFIHKEENSRRRWNRLTQPSTKIMEHNENEQNMMGQKTRKKPLVVSRDISWLNLVSGFHAAGVLGVTSSASA